MRILTFIFLLPLCVSAADVNPWSKFTGAIGETSESIGGYSSGCLKGSSQLPVNGVGFETVNRHRRRYYGHPLLISSIQNWGHVMESQWQSRIIVGDISQPVGGPSTKGHKSHQIGLDADLRFYLIEKKSESEVFPVWDNENNIETPSLVEYKKIVEAGKTKYTVEFLEKYWNQKTIELLTLVGQEPKIERILMNAPIKKFLCMRLVQKNNQLLKTEQEKKDFEKFMHSSQKVKESPYTFPDWLAKVRPESGHVRHFHLRMSCDAKDKQCEPQKPVVLDATDASLVGCSGAALNEWFTQSRLKIEMSNPEVVGGESPEPAVPYWIKVHQNKKFPKECLDLSKSAL